jgi:hypothetical protein
LTDRQLSKQIEISPTSVSKILIDQSEPRQINLTRLTNTLGKHAEEEQMVVMGGMGLKDSMTDEIEQVTRYLEVRSMSVAFKNDVEAVLRNTGISSPTPLTLPSKLMP